MGIIELLSKTIELSASDLHITVGHAPCVRLSGGIVKIDENLMTIDDTLNLSREILDEKSLKVLEEKGEIDTSYSYPKLGRFRVNVFKQRGNLSIAIRVIGSNIPSIKQLGLPNIIEELSNKKRGLILVTGPTGSGKSTTLASMIDMINTNRNEHILTLEDPIEYLHNHKKSIINQREIGSDSKTFASALRASLRQDPDVILVGEMRDLETIQIALTAAETGHLVLSTLHTIGAAKTIDRIIDVFPPHNQQQIRVLLSSVLEGVISQQLLPTKDGKGRVVATETMIVTPAIRNLIREGKTHQIQTSIQTGARFGMKTMDTTIIELYNNGLINKNTLENYAVDLESIKRFIGI